MDTPEQPARDAIRLHFRVNAEAQQFGAHEPAHGDDPIGKDQSWPIDAFEAVRVVGVPQQFGPVAQPGVVQQV